MSGGRSPRRLLRRLCACIVLAVALGSSAIRAADGPVAPPVAEPDTPAPPADGVLVMRTGRLVEGRISQSAGGYMVDLPNGRMLIPFTQVQLQADDRRDAYRKLRATIPAPTAENHVALARWCLTYQLYSETRAELREALRLDPQSQEARKTLARLNEILDPQQPEDEERPEPSRTLDGFEPPEVRSLAGLPRELAGDYMLKVQPILMNGCATARCHGPSSSNGLRLERVHFGRGSRRALSEQNLATVLRYVDPQDADRSPLLLVPRGNHGRAGRPIFRGPGGARQLESLQRWVRQVAVSNAAAPDDRPPAPAADAARLDGGPTPRRSARGTKPGARPGPAPGYQLTPAMRAVRDRLERRDILTEILRDERKDEFDPEAFNRAAKQRPKRENRLPQ